MSQLAGKYAGKARFTCPLYFWRETSFRMASRAVKSYRLFAPSEGRSKARTRHTITAAVFMAERKPRKQTGKRSFSSRQANSWLDKGSGARSWPAS